MFDFKHIDTVLLDMDGTLLDLQFDNQFWLNLVPQTYAAKHQISLDEAREQVLSMYQQVKGTLKWYCLDYWQQTLDLPILELKNQLTHLIKIRPDVPPFLEALRQANKHLILLTNAHPDSLNLKLHHVPLAKYLDEIISTHQFGYAKEAPQLWQAVQQHLQYDPQKCLFIDDNEPLLDIAQNCGIGHVLAVANPDSSASDNTINHYPAITDFTTLIPSINS